DNLENKKVSEIMNIDIPRLNIDDPLIKGVEMLIDHPFVCVENDEHLFEGILTRRAILKKVFKEQLLPE
ncbi:MAG: CBS domain-containing protein, partial [Peribacillus sp.]